MCIDIIEKRDLSLIIFDVSTLSVGSFVLQVQTKDFFQFINLLLRIINTI